MKPKRWIFVVSSGENEIIMATQISGSINYVKKYIAGQVGECSNGDLEEFKNGTTTAKDIKIKKGMIKCYAKFRSYRVDFAAIALPKVG